MIYLLIHGDSLDEIRAYSSAEARLKGFLKLTKEERDDMSIKDWVDEKEFYDWYFKDLKIKN